MNETRILQFMQMCKNSSSKFMQNETVIIYYKESLWTLEVKSVMGSMLKAAVLSISAEGEFRMNGGE